MDVCRYFGGLNPESMKAELMPIPRYLGGLHSMLRRWVEYLFLGNNFDLSAKQIGLLYKKRRQIELFFLQINRSIYGLSQILGTSLWGQNSVSKLFVNLDAGDIKEQNYNQHYHSVYFKGTAVYLFIYLFIFVKYFTEQGYPDGWRRFH